MKVLVTILAVLLLTGCASMQYTTADGTNVSYIRFLTSADRIEATVGDAHVEVNGQKIDVATLQYLLGSMVK